MKTIIVIVLCLAAVAIGALQSFALNGFKRDKGSKTYYVIAGALFAAALAVGLLMK